MAAVLLLGVGPVKAALTVQGNGTVYDSVQDISWDQDGNAVKTLCDANDPIWQAFDPSVVSNNSDRTHTEICDDDGRLNWFEAEAWVAHLNAQSYKGIANWRQWTVAQPDPSCSNQTDDTPPQGFGYRCTGSEMGHLLNVAAPNGLGNTNHLSDACSPNCLTNTGPFANFRSFAYWSGMEFAPNSLLAWGFYAHFGYQGYSGKDFQFYVWAVRPGQVEPPSGGAWGLVLLGLVLMVVAWARLR